MKNNTSKKILKKLDYLIILLSLIFVIVSLRYSFFNKSSGANILVTGNEGEFIYDLTENNTFGVRGPLGVSIVVLENGTAFFQSSPCDNQICVLSHPIQHNMDFIACLPNQVFIRIESEDEIATIDNSDNSLDIIGY